MGSILADLEALKARLGLPPSRRDVAELITLVERAVLTLVAEGIVLRDPVTGAERIKIGRGEVIYLVLGDRLRPEGRSVLRELADLGHAIRLTGRHDPDGSGRPLTRDPPLNERNELPPPPPPRDEDG